MPNYPCGCGGGITAPYCPPPACPPMEPMGPMDCCPQRPGAPCGPSRPPMHKAVHWPRPVKPTPPAHHSGVVCQPTICRPQKPHSESVLLQKIICCERRNIPQLCTRLALDGLPACARPPYRLMAVQQSGAQPWWTPLDHQGPDVRQHIRICIPVCCQVCDCEGKMYHATAVVEAEVSYRMPTENWRCSLFIVPSVRLCGGDVCAEEACFCVKLEICLELYLLRPEPCAMHRPEPPCPELPLYPIPPDWQRYPAGQHPYGWPAQG